MRIIELATGKRAAVSQIDHGAMSLMIEHGMYTEQINIQQIYDERRTIETRIVTLASIRRSDEEAAALVALVQAMHDAHADPARLMELDLDFHMTLARASKNPVFVLIVGAFQGITRTTWPIGWKSRASVQSQETILATHTNLARAIAASDPRLALDLVNLHFDESIRALLAAGL